MATRTCEDGGHEAETCRNDNVALRKLLVQNPTLIFVKDVVAEEKYRAV